MDKITVTFYLAIAEDESWAVHEEASEASSCVSGSHPHVYKLTAVVPVPQDPEKREDSDATIDLTERKPEPIEVE